MEKTTYNGWMNYATWRVNLEIFDSMNPEDLDLKDEDLGSVDLCELADAMNDYANEMIEQGSQDGLAKDYALAFLGDVNWYEIAEVWVEAHIVPTDETRSYGGR
jgi:hypothetical protein